MRGLLPALRKPQPGVGEDLIHLVCCDDDVALCGEDVSGQAWTGGTQWCVVCKDLDPLPVACGPQCRVLW